MNVKKSKMGSKKRNDIIFVTCLVILPLLQYFIFYVCVNFNSLIMAFQTYEIDATTGLGAYKWGAGLSNFENLIHKLTEDGILLICLKNSLLFYGTNFFIGTSFSLVFAYYISRGQFGGNVFKIILFLPSIISAIVTVQIFMSFADNVIPAIYTKITGEEVLGLMSRRETKLPMLLFYNIWVGFGTGVLLYSGAMKNISTSILEAGKIDGTSPIQEFFHLVLPLIFPTFKTFVLSGLTCIFTSDYALFSFKSTGADSFLWTFGYYMIKEIRLSSLAGLPELASFGLLLTCVAVPLTFTVRFIMNKWGPSVE